jgi:hypothetical protein
VPDASSASAAGRRAVGEPCERCTKTALGAVRRRVHAGLPKSSGRVFADGGRLLGRPARHVNAGTRPDPRTKLHDPFGTCRECREFRLSHPDAALTANGIPQGLAPHAWNEKTGTAGLGLVMKPGGGRRDPSDVGSDTQPGDHVKIGDRVRCRETYGPREGEVLEVVDERLLLVRRERPRGELWHSLDGGVHSILRSRVYEVVGR